MTDDINQLHINAIGNPKLRGELANIMYNKCYGESIYEFLIAERLGDSVSHEWINKNSKIANQYIINYPLVSVDEYVKKHTNYDDYISLRCDCDNMNADAITLAGDFWFAGYSVIKQNRELAFLYYKKAAELNDSGAEYKLGLCYLFGLGTQRNIPLGVSYIKKAIDNGMNQYRFDLLKYCIDLNTYEDINALWEIHEIYNYANSENYIVSNEILAKYYYELATLCKKGRMNGNEEFNFSLTRLEIWTLWDYHDCGKTNQDSYLSNLICECVKLYYGAMDDEYDSILYTMLKFSSKLGNEDAKKLLRKVRLKKMGKGMQKGAKILFDYLEKELEKQNKRQ